MVMDSSALQSLANLFDRQMPKPCHRPLNRSLEVAPLISVGNKPL